MSRAVSLCMVDLHWTKLHLHQQRWQQCCCIYFLSSLNLNVGNRKKSFFDKVNGKSIVMLSNASFHFSSTWEELTISGSDHACYWNRSHLRTVPQRLWRAAPLASTSLSLQTAQCRYGFEHIWQIERCLNNDYTFTDEALTGCVRAMSWLVGWFIAI